MSSANRSDADQLARQVAILRDIMLTVHYFEESHWLAAAVSFPHLCASALAQQALRRAATIAWQMSFPAVAHWLRRDLLVAVESEADQRHTSAAKDQMRIPPLADCA